MRKAAAEANSLGALQNPSNSEVAPSLAIYWLERLAADYAAAIGTVPR
jgi:hypothetical protein